MSAADEVTKMNTLNRTYVVTYATASALLVIDNCKVVFNLDCAVGTGLLALHTADTAVGANLTNLCALIVAGALNNNAYGILYDVNNVVGTSLLTKSATNTLLRINLCDTLFAVNADSISGTNCHTVAIAKAGEGTVAVTRIIKISSNAGLYTVVYVLSLLGLAGAVAGYVSNLLYNVTGSKTHNLTDFFGNTVATGDTEAGVIALALTESLCVSVTTRVTAGAAVSARKAITYCNYLFIFLNSEEGCGNSKKNCTNKCNYCKNN